MPSIESLVPSRSLDKPDDLDWFWSVLDASLAPSEDEQLARLKNRLFGLSDQELVDFIHLFREVHASLYSMRLWAACYLINGGCSDDGFIDFRNWLMARGRGVSKRAVADVESLADLQVEMDSASFEWFGYAMTDVYRLRARGAYPGQHAGRPILRDLDWDFDFDDEIEMRRRLPRLAAQYLP